MLFFDKGIKIIEEISAAQYSSYKSKDHPKAFMIVGQPGAGKTQIIKRICEFFKIHPSKKHLSELLMDTG